MDDKITLRIKKAFMVEMKLQKADFIVEKSPINNFRLYYLNAMFPKAKYIHLIRNGIEVAHSISRKVKADMWYAGIKWPLLAEYARIKGFSHLIPLVNTPFKQGLLEWKLNLSAGLEFYSQFPQHRFITIYYKELVNNPKIICDRIENFLEIPFSQEMREFAVKHIKRRSPIKDPKTLTPETDLIAGDLLRKLNFI